MQRGTRRELTSAVVRFAGDSGDGMQLTGAQFTQAHRAGRQRSRDLPGLPGRDPGARRHHLRRLRLPDPFRRPAHLDHRRPLDVLVAMNPAALKTNLARAQPGGIVVIDNGSFNERSLKKAGLAADPRHDGSLDPYRVIRSTSRANTKAATKHTGLSVRERCAARTCARSAWSTGCTSATAPPPSAGSSSSFKDHPPSPPPMSRR